jgi:hypothetical protein
LEKSDTKPIDELIQDLNECKEASVVCNFHPALLTSNNDSIEWWKRLSVEESRGAAKGFVSRKVAMSTMEVQEFSSYVKNKFSVSQAEQLITSEVLPFTFTKTSVQIYLKGNGWARRYTLVGDRLFLKRAQQPVRSDTTLSTVKFFVGTQNLRSAKASPNRPGG